jgi:hypothetical protein
MKPAALGALLGAGLVIVAAGLFGQRTEVFAQHAAPYQATGSGNDLIALPMPAGDKSQMLTVIDPRQQAMGVYHVDLSSGKITLLSVRNIRWDLQMIEFNGVNPLPREIRLQLEQR